MNERRQLFWKVRVMMCASPSTGNRCGHDPSNPRFMIQKVPYGADGKHRATDNTGNTRRSMIQYAMISKVHEYFENPSMLPMLNAINGSSRQQRSERRESIVSFLEACIYSMDMVSLRIGYPTEEGFVFRTMDYLTELAGINGKRAERALKDIKSCGFISVKKACRKNDDETYSSIASTKCIAKEFLAYLGFDKWMDCERNRAAKRQKDKVAENHKKQAYSPKGRAKSVLVARMMAESLASGSWANPSAYNPTPDPNPLH